MKIDWKKVLKTSGVLLTGVGAVVAAICLSRDNSSSLESWLGSASDDELSNDYEERRQNWILGGYGGSGEKPLK